MKKNVYFFQVNYEYNHSAHLPYTVAHLACYAWNDEKISQSYELKDLFFLRKPPSQVIETLESPAIVGFSTYVWNCEYNKKMARMIKERYPECVILFGGHHIMPGDGMLEECPYIDYLIHGEGEEPLRRLMLALDGEGEAKDVPGISMRSENGCLTNQGIVMGEDDFPSPYLEGYFDKIIDENPDINFLALIETSRGCPYSCSYCDWSNMKSKIRQFPLERILKEIDWMSEKKIFGLGAADSNFGFYERDEFIAEKIVESHLKTGYPGAFQTSYAKNSSERIFRIGCALDKCGLNKGITLSFQSMSPVVLKNIGRENISVGFYSGLMKKYTEAGVSAYTELILGLPGENYESFTEGVDSLLRLGQHDALYIHNCECLPCSIMGTPDYMERFKIKTTRIHLNQPHRNVDEKDSIAEWSHIVTGTYSMDGYEWARMNMFSFCVQAYHNMGMLKFFALYLFEKGECTYREFYSNLLEYLRLHPDKSASKTFYKIFDYLNKILSESGDFVCSDETFGNVLWPFEEYVFLCAAYNTDDFYAGVYEYLASFSYEPGVFEELLKFQREMIKQPFLSEKSFETEFDFIDYFTCLQRNSHAQLVKKPCRIDIKTKRYDSWREYARKVAWYGRKNDQNTYINDALTYGR